MITALLFSFAFAFAFANTPLDCSAIAKAIDGLPKSGGQVVLTEGVYSCSTPVVLNRDNISIVGAGSERTILRIDDGLAFPVIVLGEPKTKMRGSKWGLRHYPITATKNLQVSGLTIDGNRHSHNNQKGHECYDFKTMSSTACGTDGGFLVRNNGITIRGAHNVVITDVITHGHLSGGIVLEKISSNILIDGFKSYDNFFDGFAGYETRNCTVRNFELTDNGYSGISVDLDFQGNIFENGRVSNNLDNGIFSAQVGNNIYRNLEVRDNATFGFYFDGSRVKNQDGSSTLIPNTCDDNSILSSVIAGGKAGVYVNHACKNLLLSAVSIQNPELNCTSYYAGSEIVEKDMTCTP